MFLCFIVIFRIVRRDRFVLLRIVGRFVSIGRGRLCRRSHFREVLCVGRCLIILALLGWVRGFLAFNLLLFLNYLLLSVLFL